MTPMPWLDSNAIRSLIGALLLNVLTWAGLCLGTGSWDWKPLAASTIAILIPFVKRLSDADVTAPVAFLNRREP